MWCFPACLGMSHMYSASYTCFRLLPGSLHGQHPCPPQLLPTWVGLWLRCSSGSNISLNLLGLAQEVPVKGQFSLSPSDFNEIHQKSPNPLLIHFHQPSLGSLFVPNVSALLQPPNDDAQCLPSLSFFG